MYASNSASDHSTSVLDEAYFRKYASKVSKMKAWQLTNELAIRVDNFDLLNDQSDQDPGGESPTMKRTMMQIEILAKEQAKRKP